jgi:hypothetical protein
VGMELATQVLYVLTFGIVVCITMFCAIEGRIDLFI